MSCIPTRCAHTGLLRAVCSANLYIFSHFYKYYSNFIPFLRDIVIYYDLKYLRLISPIYKLTVSINFTTPFGGFN